MAYRPIVGCLDCWVCCVDMPRQILWCNFYKKMVTGKETKPDFCKVTCIEVSEDLSDKDEVDGLGNPTIETLKKANEKWNKSRRKSKAKSLYEIYHCYD